MASTLVINPGSSSRKYALFVDGRTVLEMRFEQSGDGYEVCSKILDTQEVCQSIKKTDFDSAMQSVSDEVSNCLTRLSVSKQPDCVVVRVVAPGTFFQQHAIVDDGYIDKLRKKESSAPLHIPIALREIQGVRHHFSTSCVIAASDSAFHQTMPRTAHNYSLPPQDADAFDIYRFGYHGLSVSSIVRRIHAVIGQDPERMVVCHIGSGTSVTAVYKGKSIDTTMGFAPGTGVIMGTRGADIDSSALLAIMKLKNWRPLDAEMYINTTCGLYGLSGQSDIRILLQQKAQHEQMATCALETFAYHIQKAVAGMVMALGGMDVLVFTATAAVRSSELRTLLTSRLEHFGVKLSSDRNELMVGRDGVISLRNSPVKVVVMRTDEMGEMSQLPVELKYSNEDKRR